MFVLFVVQNHGFFLSHFQPPGFWSIKRERERERLAAIIHQRGIWETIDSASSAPQRRGGLKHFDYSLLFPPAVRLLFSASLLSARHYVGGNRGRPCWLGAFTERLKTLASRRSFASFIRSNRRDAKSSPGNCARICRLLQSRVVSHARCHAGLGVRHANSRGPISPNLAR